MKVNDSSNMKVTKTSKENYMRTFWRRPHQAGGIWKRRFAIKTHQMFSIHTRGGRNLKPQRSLVILDLCLTKTRARKSRDYRDVIVFKKLRFRKLEKPVFIRFEESFRKLRFRDGLAWTIGLTVEIKLRFQKISSVVCLSLYTLLWQYFCDLKITFSLAISASHWTVDLDTCGQWYGSRVVWVQLW